MATDDDKTQGAVAILKRYAVLWLNLFWSVATETWTAASRIVGDLYRKWESERLKGEVEEQKVALGEKLLASGSGDVELCRRLTAKNQEIQQAESNKASTKTLIAERRTLLAALGSAALTSTAHSDDTQAIRKAQEASETHKIEVADLFATRPPVDKRRAWVGAGLLLVAFVAATGDASKDRERRSLKGNGNAMAEKAQVASTPPQAAMSGKTQDTTTITAAGTEPDSTKEPIVAMPTGLTKRILDLTAEQKKEFGVSVPKGARPLFASGSAEDFLQSLAMFRRSGSMLAMDNTPNAYGNPWGEQDAINGINHACSVRYGEGLFIKLKCWNLLYGPQQNVTTTKETELFYGSNRPSETLTDRWTVKCSDATVLVRGANRKSVAGMNLKEDQILVTFVHFDQPYEGIFLSTGAKQGGRVNFKY